MNKDVIYIDVDDDVTAIIGKIKNTKEKIVALVPPKRAGVLQSAVNLRLLDRMARNEKKQLVLITANQALVGLAASAQIPVAKNLQTKPEVAPIAALKVDDGDDIIDGAALPVGEHAKTVRTNTESSAPRQPIPVRTGGDIDVSGIDIEGEDVRTATAVKPAKSAGAAGRKSPKIPNFDTFRKKLIWIIGGGAALVALLVWMFVFAPAATIVITASTSPLPVNTEVKLGGTELTNANSKVISSIVQREEVEDAVEFEATGEKDVGEKASGTIIITNCDGPGFTLSAGTAFTAPDGKVYYSTTSASVSSTTGSSFVCRGTGAGAGTGSVTVEAADIGSEFNAGSSSYRIGGISGDIYAQGGAMSGGSSKTVKVVTEDDVVKAQERLTEKSADEYRKLLEEKFTADQVVIGESFFAERGETAVTPAIGQEAPDGEAKLSVKTSFSIQAVAKTDLEEYLRSHLESALDNPEAQKIYGVGVEAASFANYRQGEDGSYITLTSTGRVGPKIEESEVKESARGKRYGDIQQSIQSIDGVQDVDVQFSYFWVTKVPNNTDKINIEFKVNENDD